MKNEFENFRLETNARSIEMEIMPSGKFYINIKSLSKWEVLRNNFTLEEISEYLQESTRTLQAMSFFDKGYNEK